MSPVLAGSKNGLSKFVSCSRVKCSLCRPPRTDLPLSPTNLPAMNRLHKRHAQSLDNPIACAVSSKFMPYFNGKINCLGLSQLFYRGGRGNGLECFINYFLPA
jgi:hypothetical protein